MSCSTVKQNDAIVRQKVFRTIKNIYAECGFFDDDPTTTHINSSLTDVDLNFDEPSTGPRIQQMHPLDKTTNRRKGKAIVRPARKDNVRLALPKDVPESPDPIREDKTHFPFLSLPGELRNQIYDELFSNATIYFQSFPDRGKLRSVPFDLYLAIRVACRQLHAESKSMLYENLTIVLAPVSGVTVPPPKIPRSVLDDLQHLIVMSYNHESISDNYLEKEQFPSLKSLVFRCNTTCVQSQIFLPDFAQNRDRYLANCVDRRVDTVKQKVTKQGWGLFDDWFTRLVERTNRAFDIVLEHELAMGTSVTEHAQDAQHLSQVLLISAAASAPNLIHKTWMTAEQYAIRHQCYLKMEEMKLDEPVAGRLPNKYQATKKRLKYMQYWERMDKFEALTKAFAAKALARNTQNIPEVANSSSCQSSDGTESTEILSGENEVSIQEAKT